MYALEVVDHFEGFAETPSLRPRLSLRLQKAGHLKPIVGRHRPTPGIPK
jgi:hypothetical protein